MTGRSALVRNHLTSATRYFYAIAAVFVLLFAAVPLAHAQVTTGSLSGTITDPDGGALPGVTVEAVHVPTGTRYDTVTDVNGRYTIPNVRVGGPYRITGTLEGFRTAELTGVMVSIGTTTNTPMQMRLAAVTEAITVTAEADPVISPDRTGSTSSVSQDMIESLPTVNRTLQDFARTNPYFTTDLSQASGTTLNVAGRNNRYNNIQIDGAVNNDLFGLAGTGTPGGQAGAQPISLDAIQQLQLVVSPYDVRQSGFTGGGVNAVTRSGTNELEGSVFYSQRDRSFVGKGINDTPVASFDQTSWGGRVGGPIVKDRLFYFVSGEQNRRESPLGISSSIYTGTGTGNLPGLQEVSNYAKSKYNLDLGDTGDIISETNNDLLFGRLDFNIGASNNLTVRHNYVKASDPSAPSSYSRNASQFYYPTSRYFFEDETNSSVAQLNTVFNANAYNEGRFVYQTIRDARTTPVLFPTVEIGGSGPRRGAVQIGTERFSGANTLDQDIIEFTNDFTLIKGDHTIVIGTHNEMFEFKNLFISDYYGYYWFRTLDDFMAGTPTNYSIGFATGDNPRRPTQFKAAQYSLYVNDQWRLPHNVTLSFGLRGDKPSFPDTPSQNPLVFNELGISTSSKPKDDIIWQPRVGFNWDPTGAGTQQVRGGVGIFLGRAPYVWISNGYGGTGIETVSLQCNTPSCTTPFNPDPLNQPRTFPAGTAAPSISVTDPDFEFPKVLRATLGYDRELFWGIKATAEVLYSETQSDIYYKNMNWVENGVSPLDGRPTYARRTTKVSDTYMVSNTELGRELSETIQLSKRLGNLQLDMNYMHQDAQSAADAGSSTASSGWNFQTTRGDIFNPELSATYFQVKHRFNAAATYDLATGAFTHSFGLFYGAQSGNPYSLLIDGNPNRDSSFSNDLLYIPTGGAGGLILCPYNNGNTSAPAAGRPCGGATPLDSALFTTFLNSVGLGEEDAGEVLERNILQQPWQRRLDFHYELGLPQLMGTRVSLTADMMNVLNLINEEWGVQEYVNFSTYTPVRYQGIDPTTNKPVYREQTAGSLEPGRQYTGTTSTASRWQASLRLRVNF